MAYAVLNDVKDAYPQIRFAGPGGLDEAKGAKIVENINAQVDSILKGLGYVTPVTGTASLKVLKDIVVQGSLAQILKALYYGIKNPDDVGANEAWRTYQNLLKALINPDDPLTLPDAQISDAASKVTAEIHGSFLTPTELTSSSFWPTRDQMF